MKILSLEKPLSLNNRFNISVFVTLLFHLAGLVGIVLWNSPFIRDMTPVHLVLMALLVILSNESYSPALFRFLFIAAILGFSSELIGVHTGVLFGSYEYGSVLGPKLWDVPLLIGVNWALVLLGSANLISALGDRFKLNAVKQKVSIIFLGALTATVFDWVMEPVAVKQNYWTWQNGVIPMLNYISWFGVSALALCLYAFSRPAYNPFYSVLLVTQLVFFTLLRLML